MNQMPDRSQFAVDDGLISPPRLQPIRALRAFAKLVEDKEDTAQVFEIIDALSGTSIQNGSNRMLRLIDEDYLALLGEPVEQVRQRLNIATPSIYLSIPADARNAYRDQPLAA